MRFLFSIVAKLLILAIPGILFYLYPGYIDIHWQGNNFETSLAVFASLLAIGLFTGYCIFVFIRTLARLPLTLRRAYLHSRQLDAQQSLVKTYLALLLNDMKSAKRLQKSIKHLAHDPLAYYLQGEVAWRLGERKKAAGWSQILQREKNASDLSQYQLMRWHEEKGDLMECLEKAQELLQTYPHSSWLLEKIFSFLLRTKQYNDLSSILERMKQEGHVSEVQFKHKRALIYYLQAEPLLTSQQHELALHYLERAHGFAPENIGITLHLIDCAKSQKNSRWLKRIIEETWAQTPHPQLYSVYVQLLRNSPSDKLVEHTLQLTSYNPQHFESYHARIRALLDIMLWGEARAILKEMTARWGETSRICTLWAELEFKEFNNVSSQAQWLQRAIDANDHNPWSCAKCYTSLSQWHPLCPQCHAFDSIISDEQNNSNLSFSAF